MSRELVPTPAATHSFDAAEVAVLGAMLTSKTFAQYGVEELTSTDFARPAHQMVFAAIQHMLAGPRRSRIDEGTVVERLRLDERLDAVGGGVFIHSLVEAAPSPEVADHYLEIVRHLAILRGERQDVASIPTIRDTLTETLEQVERLHEERRELTGVPTGFPYLDRLTSGLQPGNLVVVASRPAMGKTTLIMSFARHAAIHAGVPTLVCSLELNRNEITQRMSCAESMVDLQRLRTGRMDEADWARLTKSLARLAEAPLWIDDSVGFTVSSIRAKAKELHRRNGLGLLVVDGIQGMLPFRPVDNLYEQVSYSVRGLKLIARELNIPVVATSQVSRQSEGRADRRPMLGDLRDSGALEDTADLIIFVYRDDVYDPESFRKGEADLILAKHRNGPTDVDTVAFLGQYARFAPIASRDV